MSMKSTAQRPSTEQIWDWLREVADPEIPMISVVDLGIVRDVAWLDANGDVQCIVTITPTYSGCPATEVIASAIERALNDRGVARVTLKRRLAPAWTTDWISESGRRKLLASGIAPPAGRVLDVAVIDTGNLTRALASGVTCPRCDSTNTTLVSRFGSTACKALFRCNDCLEPFDYFKSH
jgi:ring-1,2-phenylacetyl-CoA epoxidase subunit PaaD